MVSSDWLEELRGILGAELNLHLFSTAQWREMSGGDAEAEINGVSIEAQGKRYYLIASDRSGVECLEVSTSEPLSPTEINLISFMLRHAKQDRSVLIPASTGIEQMAAELGHWINSQQDFPGQNPLPDELSMGGRLYSEMIPLLLVRDYPGGQDNPYTELDRLLRTFLAEEVLLIPLQRNEWLILSPISLLRDSQLDGADEAESQEDSLKSIGLGLQEMLSSEWLGECHLALSLPMHPAKSVAVSVRELRETVELGRRFQVGSNLHLPWELELERLLSSIPEGDRNRFVDQALSRSDYYVEPEIFTTLETFFALDCNVSETAKRLYIHRNTLLYRLDKLKHETGLDVRLFREAVRVKIILLLYKVTKRS